MVFEHSQFLQRELHQSPIHGMEIRARAEGVAQLVGRCAQALVRESGQRRRIRLAVGECLQHAACAGAEQIGDDTRELDVRFFEQRFQSVVELDAVARDLVLPAHHGPPEPLLGVGHKAQGELLCDQPLHQTFRVRKVLLATTRPAIRLRLCKVERPGERARAVARPALRPPVLLQCLPHRSPILRGRFHHDFLDLALDEPVSQRAQFARARPDLPAFEVVVALDLDVGHDHGQHLLVHVDSCDPVRIGLSWRERRACLVASIRVASYRGVARAPTTLNYSVNHARSGPDSCSASTAPLVESISPLHPVAIVPQLRIFITFRGLKAQADPVAEIVRKMVIAADSSRRDADV